MAVSAPAAARPPTVADAIDWGERAFVVLAMLLYSSALLPVLFAKDADPESSAILRIIWLPVYAVTQLAMLARPIAQRRAIERAWLLWLPVALAMASAFWSLDSGVTVRRGFALVMTTAFGSYLAARYSWRDLLGLLAIAHGVLAVGSALICIAVPAMGVHQTEFAGAWKGLWIQKNALGANMVRTVLICCCAAIYIPQRRRMLIAIALLAAALVILSRSTTSLLGLLLLSFVFASIRIVRLGPAGAVALGYCGLLFGGALAVGLAVAPEEIFGVFGKDATLTGRTSIWSALGDQIALRPWLGWGYGVFWTDPRGPAFWVREITQWHTVRADNGWFETALATGLVGVGAFALLSAALTLLAVLRLPRGRAGYFIIPWLVTYFLFSISESTILERNSLVWAIFAAVAVKLFHGQDDPALPPVGRRQPAARGAAAPP